MWSLFLRAAYFFILLTLAFGLGWEFMMAGIVFFVTLGRNNWEFLLLGLLLDLVLSFPLFFFTFQIFAVLMASLFGEELFKTENLYNYLTKAFLLSILITLISLPFFIYDFLGDLRLLTRYGTLIFAKNILATFNIGTIG